VVENSSEIVTVVDPDGTLRYANPALERALGYDPEEAVGTINVLDHVHAEDLPHVLEETERALSEGGIATNEAEYRFRHKDGSWRWIQSVGTYLLDDPEVRGVAVVSRDVTARVEAGERLRFQAQLLDTVGEAVIALDVEGRVAYWNRAAETLYGWSSEEAMGGLLRDMVVSEDLQGRAGEIAGQLREGRAWRGEFVVRRRDGTKFPVEGTSTPVFGEDGGVIGVIGVLRDVAERKESEEALRESRAEIFSVLERITDAFFALDHEFRFTYVNSQASDLFTNSIEDLLGKRIWEDPTFYPEYRRALLQGRTARFEARYPPTGAWYNVRAYPSGTGLSVYLQDITERKRAEEALKESEERYRTLVETVPAVTYTDRAAGSYPDVAVYTSPQIEALVGYTVREWLDPERDLWGERLHPEDRAWVLAADGHAKATGEPFAEEYRLIARDGRVVWVRDEAALTRDEAGEPRYWQGVLVDVTERKVAEEAMKESERSLVAAQRIAHVGNFEYSVEDDEARWSDELYRIFGFAPRQFVPTYKSFMRSVHPDDRGLVKETVREALFGERRLAVDYRIVRRNGEVRYVRSDYEVVRDASGRAVRLVGTVHDVTERKALEEQLEHQALHDPLTHLPNRRLFADRLLHALERTRRRGGVAVLFMDLDDFKVVNDSLGHETGDLLLVVVAQRLSRCLRPEDTLARFGGDEFVVLLEDVEDPGEAVRVAERIVRELRRPFVLGGRELYAPASIGVSWGDARTKSSEDLLRDADTAMYQAKREGSDYRVFDPAMYERVVRRLALENDLRRAAEAEEFVVHYQPIFDFGSREPWGVEALVRWNHPERGMLGPAEFVTVAEEMGLIVPIGSRVLEEACHRVKGWQETHPRNPPLGLIVNLSVAQLLHPGYEETVRSALARSGLGAESLKLDVTESAFIDALESNRLALERIQALGVRISIDDFGMGYSSLSYLKRLPAAALKIDKSFVKGFGEDAQDTAIVRMVVELAHTLGMEVVAEGVETWAQAALLAEMGCDMAQGYHFARPLPAEAVAGFLGSAHPNPAHRSDAGGPPDG
jgi:diguanylate cyclase (GGDEF)-like protein/PAS domain S-box-containing protein